ncbi:MAG: hypothetical protein LAO08_12045 [Acidobacteriia bacterium]|nr:hypothetical protein [Terriglobia bacterium]
MQARTRHLPAYAIAALSVGMLLSSAVWAMPAPQQAASKASAAPAPKRDLTGVWQLQGTGSAESAVPDKDMPPMTPWAKVRFDAEKPGYGPRGAPGGNDPILQCDPIGFPRIMYMPLPMEFVQVPGRMVQFFEREHEYRTIWTDGRSLPQDADPTWYGYAIGRWEGDDTFVVESSGFNDKTWLAPTGYPHSEDMRITERYRRLDSDTIQYQITITDPTAYARPAVGPPRIYKRKPGAELEELPCVWSEENSFTKRIREPAASKPAK